MDAFRSLFGLRWSQKPLHHPLPDNITRTFIATDAGSIELLVCNPTVIFPSPSAALTKAPILFVHGGFGHASVWLPWMSYLSNTYAARTYAVSVRGHGGSWCPSFLRMWYLTTIHMMATDVVAALEEVERRENGKKVVLVGHSSGGGLAQYLLDHGMVKVEGLALVGAIPNFGAWRVFRNWFFMDPWFLLRTLLHVQHPRSPLSSTTLVQNAFFGHEFPREGVREFESWMPKYESMSWPLAMMGITTSFVSVARVLTSIRGLGSSASKIMVLVGEEDKLVDVRLAKRTADDYRQGLAQMQKEKNLTSPSSKEMWCLWKARVSSEKKLEV